MTKKYNYTRKTGRPTKYKPEYCQKIIEFFDVPLLELYKDNLGLTKEKPTSLKFLFEFAKSIGVNDDTLNEWSHKHVEFSAALKAVEKLRERHLVNNALEGRYNSTAFIFTMKNILGWRDKSEVEHSGDVMINYGHRKA